MPSQRCVAKAKSTGVQCARFAIMGGTTCRVHGSGNKRSKLAAKRNVEEAAAKAAMVTLGLPVDGSATDLLLGEVRWATGHVQWLRGKVQELDPEALVWGTSKVVDKTGEVFATDTTSAAQASMWYELYDRERKHQAALLSLALKSGVDERRVRLAESQGEQVAAAIKAILADLGLTAEQQAAAPEVASRHLRLLAGGAA